MKIVKVFLRTTGRDRYVGRIAEKDRKIFFEYDSNFLAHGFAISPYLLPLKSGVFEEKKRIFEGLYGVFDDSLPDGWGLMLMKKAFLKNGIDPSSTTPCDWLSYIGDRGMGALVYKPEFHDNDPKTTVTLQSLANQVETILEGNDREILPEMLRAGGSPGGARPKVVVGIKGNKIKSGGYENDPAYEQWIVKFRGKNDAEGSGELEYIYSNIAKKAGIEMPDTRLFQLDDGRSLFGVRRFDRAIGHRIHFHSFSGMIHANYRIPDQDYKHWLELTLDVTRDHSQLVEAYRRMVFNIVGQNKDDHAKNFGYLYRDGRWRLSPAYDLTYAKGPGGEHSMTIMGEGKNISFAALATLANEVGIKQKTMLSIIDQVICAFQEEKVSLSRVEGLSTEIQRTIKNLKI